MRIAMIFLAGIMLAATAGCGNKSFKDFFTFKKNPQSQPAATPTVKTDHDGWYLAVFVDTKQTRAGKKIDKDQLWDVDSCGGNFFFKYTAEDGKLGKLRQADVIFKPIIDGKVDETAFYQPRILNTEEGKNVTLAGNDFIAPGKEFKLVGFDYVAPGKFASPASLPPGQYQLSVTAHGESDWDRQLIRLTVK